jgi:hypothetical protein
MRLWRILLNAQGAEGGTTTTETPAATPAAATIAAAKTPDLKAAAEGLVAKHGDPTAALLVLMGDNYRLRDEKRELAGRVPAADAVVLAGDHARDYESYKALGKPADVKRSLAERDLFKAESDGFKKDTLHRRAAEIHGYRPSVLARLAEHTEIVIGHLQDARGAPVDRDGKVLAKDAAAIPAAFVKGEGDTLTRLDEHANSAWKDFLPSLAAEPVVEQSKTTPRQGQGGHRTIPAGQGSAEVKRVRSTF